MVLNFCHKMKLALLILYFMSCSVFWWLDIAEFHNSFVNCLNCFVLQPSPSCTGVPETCPSGAASPSTWQCSWTSLWPSSTHWRVSVEVSLHLNTVFVFLNFLKLWKSFLFFQGWLSVFSLFVVNTRNGPLTAQEMELECTNISFWGQW